MTAKQKSVVIIITIFVILLFILSVSGSKTKKVSEKENIPQNKDEETAIFTIPGLTKADIVLNLEQKGIACTEPGIGGDGLYSWECKEETSDHLYLVEVIDKSTSEILSVQATVLNYGTGPTDEIVKDFLGYIASLPYTNAKQDQARNWLEQNLTKPNSTIINGVRFTLVGEDRSRMLTIAHENSDLD